jgi:hypothetical protein
MRSSLGKGGACVVGSRVAGASERGVSIGVTALPAGTTGLFGLNRVAGVCQLTDPALV